MSGVRAWTLGYGPAYEQAVRMPENGKAPGGFAFRTADDAVAHAESHGLKYQPYEMELPGTFEACTTRSRRVAAEARHKWHITEGRVGPHMDACGVCTGHLVGDYDFDVLTVIAPFINPDTGRPA